MITDEHRKAMKGEISKELALELYESKWWKDMEPRDVARIQLGQRRLCMDFPDFQAVTEIALGRGVFTHEFCDFRALIIEGEELGIW